MSLSLRILGARAGANGFIRPSRKPLSQLDRPGTILTLDRKLSLHILTTLGQTTRKQVKREMAETTSPEENRRPLFRSWRGYIHVTAEDCNVTKSASSAV